MAVPPDAHTLVLQYRLGAIPANVFADQMRSLNYSTQQITQIIMDSNNPRAPRSLPLPEPDGNVLPPVQQQATAPQAQPQPQTQPAPAPAPAPTQSISPETVALAREATARSEEGPTYGRPESALMTIPRSEDGPWYGRPEPSNAQRAVNIARQTIPTPPRRVDVMGDNGGEQARPSALMQFIRGDFREGADQRVQEAIRRQAEESGVQPGKAEGGATTGKGQNARDAALHKALEIIHMMLSRH